MTHIGFQCREAISNLWLSKLRSFLAVLGIFIGTASVVAMISGGKLATQQVLAQFKSLGTNLLSVELVQNQQAGSGGSTETKVSVTDALKLTDLPDVLDVAPYVTDYSNISFAGEEIDAVVLGGELSFASIAKIQLSQGRFVRLFDRYQPYAVLGQDVYQKIKQQTFRNVIGQQIKIGNVLFTIIGVAKPWQENPFLFENINESIIVPINTISLLSKNATIRNLLLRFREGANINVIQNNITRYFAGRYPNIKLNFVSPKAFLQRMKEQQGILTLFLGFIGSISLLVGGIGVMNIMLVSVTERRREIGIRMAIGAKGRDIQSLFLIESIVLSLFGGTLGVCVGVFISWLIAFVKSWAFTLFLLPPLIGFAVSVSIGIFFGFYPAYRASKLDPIEALRTE